MIHVERLDIIKTTLTTETCYIDPRPFNPIENAWSELNKRLGETDPETLEKFDAFKLRVANAVRWLKENRADRMENMVKSMPRRLEECLTLKGARTGY